MAADDVAGPSPGDEPQKRLSRREQRAENLRSAERKEMPFKVAKFAVIAIVAVLVIAGLAYGLPKLLNLGKCEMKEKHEHATFWVIDNGTRVRFLDPRHDLEGPRSPGKLPMKAHLHQDDDMMLHLEYGCSSVADFFGFLDGELKPGYFRLPDGATHGTGGGADVSGKVLQDSGNMTLRFFLFTPDGSQPGGGHWDEKPDLHRHQLRSQQRALITYGSWTDDQIGAQQTQVPPPSTTP